MRTLDLENQFIELRARGHSLRDIAEQLNVSKSTLSRWEPELAPQIHRLRRLLWEDAEAELGRSLEQDMKQLAARIRKFEDRLDQYNLTYCTLPNVLKVIRECRREYMHRRAILMAERPPKTALSRAPSPCEPAADSETRDKTGHISDNTTQNPQKTTASNRLEPDLSHSVVSGGASSVEPHFSSTTSCNPTPPSADAVHDSAAAASHDSDTAIDRSQALPLPWAADEVSRPQVPPVLGDSQPSTLSARPEGPQPHDDFLGSVVINRLECGAGVLQKWLEHEAAHRQRKSSLGVAVSAGSEARLERATEEVISGKQNGATNDPSDHDGNRNLPGA